MWGISWLTENQLASQEAVSKYVSKKVFDRSDPGRNTCASINCWVAVMHFSNCQINVKCTEVWIVASNEASSFIEEVTSLRETSLTGQSYWTEQERDNLRKIKVCAAIISNFPFLTKRRGGFIVYINICFMCHWSCKEPPSVLIAKCFTKTRHSGSLKLS
jgi:hypothetical protein